MARNAAGATRHTNKEWGKGRKAEARERGLNNSARRDAIREFLTQREIDEMLDVIDEVL